MDLANAIRMWRLIATEAIVNSEHHSDDLQELSNIVRIHALNIARSMEKIMLITQCACENCAPVKH